MSMPHAILPSWQDICLAFLGPGFESQEFLTSVFCPGDVAHISEIVSLYAMAVQLLSYHVAIIKGTDVDQPRNLAKSVTVE